MVPWILFQDDYFGSIFILLTKTQESLRTTISNLSKRKKVGLYCRKVLYKEDFRYKEIQIKFYCIESNGIRTERRWAWVENRELKQPRRRRQQERHKFAYLTKKNNSFARFARFARALFIFLHFADVVSSKRKHLASRTFPLHFAVAALLHPQFCICYRRVILKHRVWTD